MLDYKKPKGIIRNSDCSHPVLGGWMTKEENEISTANIYTPSKLPKAIRTKLEQWRKDLVVLNAEKEIAEADHNALRDMLASIARKNMKTNVAPALTNTIYRYQDFYMQCYLLTLLPSLCDQPEEKSVEEWARDDLGLNSINDVYPVLTQEGHLYMIRHLIYDFGYGPNCFDWQQRKPFILKGSAATLYLIAIDVGLIAGAKSHIAWKVGITKGEVIGESPRKSRFSGAIADHITVLRKKKYADARDAYMIEQTMIKCSRRDAVTDIDAGKDPLNPVYPRQSSSFLVFSQLPPRTQNKLGYTEWIYSAKSQAEVESIFDGLTAYPAFYGSASNGIVDR